MTAPKDQVKTAFYDYLIIRIKDRPEDNLEVRCYGRLKSSMTSKHPSGVKKAQTKPKKDIEINLNAHSMIDLKQ